MVRGMLCPWKDRQQAKECGSLQNPEKARKQIPLPSPASKRDVALLRSLYAGQAATVRTGHGTTDCFQIGKEYVRAVYCHPAYLTYMQSTS